MKKIAFILGVIILMSSCRYSGKLNYVYVPADSVSVLYDKSDIQYADTKYDTTNNKLMTWVALKVYNY